MTDLIRREDVMAAISKIWWYYGDTKNARAVVAALPAVTVGVKPLVWVETNDGNHRKGECFSTRSPVSFAPIAAHKKHDGWWLNVDCKTYPTLDAAKAAAQADYEARILAALEPVAAPDPTAIREAALLNENGDLIGHPLEMQLRAEWRKVAKHHQLPNDGVVEADLVRAFLALIQKEPTDDRA